MEMLIGKLIVAEMKEINNQQNARYAARRLANNSNPIEESLVRRVVVRRAWLGPGEIIVAETKEIGLGEMKLIIDKMLEMLLDTKECIV